VLANLLAELDYQGGPSWPLRQQIAVSQPTAVSPSFLISLA
jgi:hypothetical protein